MRHLKTQKHRDARAARLKSSVAPPQSKDAETPSTLLSPQTSNKTDSDKVSGKTLPEEHAGVYKVPYNT